jgi:metal-responsive CopG/Arc/MetJ family transcriptional regulator
MKTAVSLNETLFEEAETLAHRLNISRSRLFALAIEEYIRRHENSELLARIDAAYADEPDAAETAQRRRFSLQQRRLVEGEW